MEIIFAFTSRICTRLIQARIQKGVGGGHSGLPPPPPPHPSAPKFLLFTLKQENKWAPGSYVPPQEAVCHPRRPASGSVPAYQSFYLFIDGITCIYVFPFWCWKQDLGPNCGNFWSRVKSTCQWVTQRIRSNFYGDHVVRSVMSGYTRWLVESFLQQTRRGNGIFWLFWKFEISPV